MLSIGYDVCASQPAECVVWVACRFELLFLAQRSRKLSKVRVCLPMYIYTYICVIYTHLYIAFSLSTHTHAHIHMKQCISGPVLFFRRIGLHILNVPKNLKK